MKWIKIIKEWVIDAALLLVFSSLIYMLVLAPNGLSLYFQVLKLRKAQESNLELIRREQISIQNNQDLLKNDKEYFDREARIVWNYVKPNEKLYWYSNMGDKYDMEKHQQ